MAVRISKVKTTLGCFWTRVNHKYTFYRSFCSGEISSRHPKYLHCHRSVKDLWPQGCLYWINCSGLRCQSLQMLHICTVICKIQLNLWKWKTSRTGTKESSPMIFPTRNWFWMHLGRKLCSEKIKPASSSPNMLKTVQEL